MPRRGLYRVLHHPSSDGTRCGIQRVVRHELDLRGVRCPLTWAHAKVRLETLGRGNELVLVVDDPQSVRDVPRAAEASGHHLIGVEPDGAAWRIVLEV